MCNTRWDSFCTVIFRLRDLLPDVLDTLICIVEDKFDLDFTKLEKEKAQYFLNFLSTIEKIYYIYFLTDILSPTKKLSLLL